MLEAALNASHLISLEDLDTLGLPLFAENADLEVKAAQGRDGSGELPQEFWHSYSAMANTDGGRVILGVREVKPSRRRMGVRYEILGIKNIEKVQKELWDGLNNRKQVSRNLLSNKDVAVLQTRHGKILEITVPRAGRKERPVFLRGNPLGNTYRRNYEGDYLCDDETVKRMLADAQYDSLDARILPKYGLDDLDSDTLRAYRNQMASINPTHPYNSYEPLEFLRAIGAYGRNRDTDEDGLTTAGLLMFGKYRSIVENLPHYNVDYREVTDENVRWSDRVTPDGTWSGNVFDFYRIAIRKLVADIKVPFRLNDQHRIDDSHVREALREALVNSIIHADYGGTMSVLVEKHIDRFFFRNPGSLRVSPRVAFEGNHSDCRNRNLQNMFMLAGAAEKAGSGLPKIARAWQEQQWYFPSLREDVENEQTTLTLTMLSLMPEESMRHLRALYGDDAIRNLSPNEALAMCVADIEDNVSNARMQELCKLHPREITKLLQGLVSKGFVENHGATSGTRYTLVDPNADLSTVGTHAPVVEEVRRSKQASVEMVRMAILEVCVADFLTANQIAKAIDRSPETVKRHHLTEMVEQGLLEPKFRQPNHPNQSYRAKEAAPRVEHISGP
jgi:predicted HTH transcriptional regulator